MVDSEIAGLLRALRGEACEDTARGDASPLSPVASKFLDAAAREAPVEDVRPAGHDTLRPIPTMWR